MSHNSKRVRETRCGLAWGAKQVTLRASSTDLEGDGVCAYIPPGFDRCVWAGSRSGALAVLKGLKDSVNSGKLRVLSYGDVVYESRDPAVASKRTSSLAMSSPSPPYYLRKVNHVTGAYWEDATGIYDIDEARRGAQEEVSSGEFDEVEIVDAAHNVIEVVRGA